MSGERGEAEVEELEDVGGEWLSEIGEDVARLLLLVVIFFAIFVPPSFCFRLEGNAEVFVHFAKKCFTSSKCSHRLSSGFSF